MKKHAIILTLIFANAYPIKNINTKYNFTTDPIDVIIPCHEKDSRTLELAIDGIRKNGINIRNIIVISEKQLSKNAEWAPEKDFPFTKKDIALAIAHGKESLAKTIIASGRIGWIYQQFLKLYAPFVIKNISQNVLVVDADTIFLNKVEFINEKGEPYFNVGTEYHKPYFDHAKKLLDGPEIIKKVFKRHSGICHHMIFQKPVLEDLFKKIENKSGKSFWTTLCENIDIDEIKGSCMSEYEIYFNFIMAHTAQAKIRRLKWANVAFTNGVTELYRKREYHYISCHTYAD